MPTLSPKQIESPVTQPSALRRLAAHPVVATIVGVFSGGVVIALVEWCGHQLVGPVSLNKPQLIPASMFAFVLLAWVLGSAVAGAVATAWGGARSIWPGVIAGVVLLATAGLNIAAFPHPLWAVAGAVVLMPTAAWWASRGVATRSAPK